MTLDFQKIPLTFAHGIDSKTDRKLVMDKLLDLQNGVFKSAGSIDKRFGYDKLSLAIAGADSISSGAALSVYKNELLLFNGTRAFSRLESTSNWIDRGAIVSVTQDTSSIIANGYQQLNPDVAINKGLAVYAWEDSRGGTMLRYSIVDVTTGASVVYDQPVTVNGVKPKVIALSNSIYIFYADGGSIKFRTINTSVPTVLSAEVAITVNASVPAPVYDLVVNGGRIYCSFHNASSGTSVTWVDSTGAIAPAEAATSGDATCVANWADSFQNVWTARTDGYTLYAYCLNFGLTPVLASTVIESINNISAIAGLNTGTNNTLYYNIPAAHSIDMSIRTSSVTISGTVSSPTTFKRSVGLITKPFVYNSNTYLNTGYSSPLQSTYFTFDSSGNVIAKMTPGDAGATTNNFQLAQAAQADDGIFVFPGLKKGRIISANNTTFSLLGVTSTQLDFANANNFLSVELGDSLFVTGGIVQNYDGVSFTEQNFHLYPDSSFITITPNFTPTPDTTPPVVTITGAS